MQRRGKQEATMPNQKDKCQIKKFKQVDAKRYEGTEKIIKILANKTSLAVLSLIIEHDEACACELEPALGITQPVVTSYLRKLYLAGILKKREQWRYSFYSIREEYKEFLSELLSLTKSD